MTPRQALHDAAVARVARRIRSRGFSVSVTPRHGGRAQPPGDILVNNRTWVAVRVAHERPVLRTVTYRSARSHRLKRYAYRYLMACWNFHCHGRRPAVQPAVYALALAGGGAALYLVPSDHVGLTRVVPVGFRNSFAQRWLERWDLLGTAVGHRAKRGAG
jgi:hypothetical protein